MDKYTKIKMIGEGSFGKALLVKSKESGKHMVVKEINMMKMARKEREEARKEVAVLAQLHHPNIVMYRESFEETGNLYIVMDYCDGGDLYSRINQQRGILFQEDMVLDWFVQICLSIKHIHDRKILHRDIKSQNIFMTRSGLIKLGDFGIAKVLNSTVELARTCIGTPYYLSPEICENKPYNNKSDVWSVGCVLYELCTLKHAFEAGNMKNLVLKIIRGSYPPVSPKYSYELRSLVAQLFKRNPRDRPSVNAILRKPLLTKRIQKFLTDAEVNSEFSHTVMHGQRIQKVLPPGGVRRPLPARPVQAKKPPTPSTPRYNPANVYGPSVARKSKDKENIKVVRRSAESRKSAERLARPASGGAGNQDLVKKRQQLLEKERQRREAERKKSRDQYNKAQRDLVEKQKISRINKDREEGWRNLVDSLGSNEEENRVDSPGPQEPISKRQPPSPKGAGLGVAGALGGAGGGGQLKDRGNYDQYHSYLDKMEQEHQVAQPAPGGAGANAVQAAARQGQAAGVRGAEAAEKARVLEDFWNRKRQAQMNKARGNADLFGGGVPAAKPRPSPAAQLAAKQNQHQEEYLARLRQIRLQNFNERRNIAEKAAGKADAKYRPSAQPSHDVLQRKKKIEALRQQADERAQKLKAELEKKRKEAYELEQQRIKAKLGGVPKPRTPDKPPRPSVDVKPVKPSVPMTDAMRAIGAVKEQPKPVPTPVRTPVGMTAAMEAIGAGLGVEDSQEIDKSPVQKKKEEILKRLNSKPPIGGDRPKWGQPVQPGAVAERPKWVQPGQGALSKLSLEETASQMEATGAQDGVLRLESVSPEPEAPPSARRQWGGPANTLLSALKQAELAMGETSPLSPSSSEESPGGTTTTATTDQPPKKGLAPAIGTTITIVKNPSGKGTVVLKKQPEANGQPTCAEADTKSSLKVSAPPASELSSENVVEGTEDAQAPSEGKDLPPKDLTPPSLSPTPSQDSSRPNEQEPSTQQEVPVSVVAHESNDVVGEEVSGHKSPLFDRVELDEEEDEEEAKKKNAEKLELEDIEDEEPTPRNQDSKPKSGSGSGFSSGSSSGSGLVSGLTTGHFDVQNARVLRTCSEPDLAKLFRTAAPQPFVRDDVSASADVAALALEGSSRLAIEEDECEEECKEEVCEEELEESHIKENGENGTEVASPAEEVSSTPENASQEEDTAEENRDAEDVEGAEDEDDDDDMETLRESMMSALQRADDQASDEEETGTMKKTKKVKKVKVKKKKIKKTRTAADIEEEEDNRSFKEALSKTSEDDLRTMCETMKSVLTSLGPGKAGKEASLVAKLQSGSGDGPVAKEKRKTIAPSILPDKESWHSDSSPDDDDDFFEDEDNTYSRLEENRVKLEQELGCDTFLKAYKTIQAIHEDEDEAMATGPKLVDTILGDGKEHLYNSILQLVMADGAFMEDND